MRLFAFMTKPWMIGLYLACILLTFLYIDKPVAIYLFALQPKLYVPWLYWLTQVGVGAVYIVGFLLGALWFRYITVHPLWEARCWFLWACVVVSTGICLVLKIVLGRARPDLWFGKKAYGFFGPHHDSLYWSFPSGHTTCIMAVAFGLSALFPRYGVWYIAFGLLVALSRVLLLQHYISDVAFAAWLALLEVGVLYRLWCYRNWPKAGPALFTA